MASGYDYKQIVGAASGAKKRPGAPKKEGVHPQDAPTNKRGLKIGWIRKTMILQESTLQDLEDYCYTERLEMRQALDDILAAFLQQYKAEHELLHKPRSD